MTVTIGTVLVVALIIVLVGALPRWEHSKIWGYGWWPSIVSGVLLIIILLALIIER